MKIISSTLVNSRKLFSHFTIYQSINNSQSYKIIQRSFAGRKKSIGRSTVKSVVASSVPPPPVLSENDAWTEIKHESGQTYWWNTVTNETTPLGASKPLPKVINNNAAPPAPLPAQSGGIMSGLGGVVAEGFAFGVGSSLARHAVGSIFGSGSSSNNSSVPNNSPSSSNDSNSNDWNSGNDDWGGNDSDGEGWDI